MTKRRYAQCDVRPNYRDVYFAAYGGPGILTNLRKVDLGKVQLLIQFSVLPKAC